MVAARSAQGQLADGQNLALILRWVDLETGEVVECASPQTPQQATLCLEKMPSIPAPGVESENGDIIIGWWSRAVYADYISESCGRYRAQDGHYNCEIFFGGVRKVIRLGLMYCACSDPQYTTTGIVHSYDIEGEIMHWGAFKNNAAVGQGYETCWNFQATNPWTSGMTGGIHQNDAYNNHYCFTRLVDVKGT